jgi:RHS repeat-associated protein
MSSCSPAPGGTHGAGATSHAEAQGRLGFNGQLHEPRGCWQFLGNGYRVYNPVLRRFHSPDSQSPFGKGGINAYAYCGGDPINHMDPSGHFLLRMAMLMGASSAALGGLAVARQAVGDDKGAAVFGVLGAALGTASMAVGVHRFRTKMPGLKQGDFRIHRGSTSDIVDVHGGPDGAQVGSRTLGGAELGALLKAEGIGSKPITLVSCGLAPQGQAVANVVGVPVTAYRGTTWPWGRSNALSFKRPVVFTPEAVIPRAELKIRGAASNRTVTGHGVRGAR